MRAASSPAGLPPPRGSRQFQKKVWFHACAALLKIFWLAVPTVSAITCSSGMSAKRVPAHELVQLLHVGRVVLAVMQADGAARR